MAHTASADPVPRERVAPLAGGPVSTPIRAAFHSIGVDLPAGRLTSAELAERLGVTEEWIVSRTGVRERRAAAPEERLSDFAARAGSAALERAGVDASELDLVIVATITQDEITPNAAPMVAHAIGAQGAGAVDVGAACTGFLSAVALGAAQIECGRAEYVVGVPAHFVTGIADYEDTRSAPLFGDAAGAAVLGPADGANGVIG